MKKSVFFLCILLFCSLILIPFKVEASPSKSFEYSHIQNRLTTSGGSQAVSINCNDLYDADLNGELLLLENVTLGYNGALDRSLRVADSGALEFLKLVITNFTPPPTNIDLNATDLYDNFFIENVLISGNGNYTTTERFYKTCTGVYVGVNATVYIYQPRWGVVWNLGNAQFLFDCKIRMGKDFQTTWFADENVSMIFSDKVISGSGQDCVNVYNPSFGTTHFRLGKLVDSTNRITENGCQLISRESTFSHEIIEAGNNPNVFVELYDTLIQGNKYFYSRIFTRCNVKIYNCIVDCVILNFGTGVSSDVTLQRINIESIQWGLMPFANVYDYDDLLIHSCDSGLYFASMNGGTIGNSSFMNNTNLAILNAISVDCFLVDSDSDIWSFTWLGSSSAELYRQYSFDLTVSFDNGSLIEDANVTISNAYLNQTWQFQTNSYGEISTQVYSMGHYNQTGLSVLYSYGAYELNITYGDYWEYHGFFLPNQTLELFVALHDPKPKDYALYLVGFCFILGVCCAILYLGWKKRNRQ